MRGLKALDRFPVENHKTPAKGKGFVGLRSK